jgi:hypothetical protein
MKYVLPILAVVALFAGQAMAADGNVSSNMLAKMGLSNMQVMSDSQGTAVRGQGYVGCVTFVVNASVAPFVGPNASSCVSGTLFVNGCKSLTIDNKAYVPGFCGNIVAGSCFSLVTK